MPGVMARAQKRRKLLFARPGVGGGRRPSREGTEPAAAGASDDCLAPACLTRRDLGAQLLADTVCAQCFPDAPRAIATAQQPARLGPGKSCIVDKSLRHEARDQSLDIGRRRPLLGPGMSAFAQLARAIGMQPPGRGREPRDISEREVLEPRRVERQRGPAFPAAP